MQPYDGQGGLDVLTAIGLRRPIPQAWGAVGDGSADAGQAINEAIAAITAVGGSELFLPRGTYLISTPIEIPSGARRFSIVGEGDATVILRGADMPTGKGVINIRGSYIRIKSIRIDGAVTQPTRKRYGTMIGENNVDDPMHPDLTKNTSIWIHHGASNVTIEDVTVTHTGGYSILIDARDGDVTNVSVVGCRFVNNRPHLFGQDDADLNYGSWTGGVHYQGDCRDPKLYSVKGLTVTGCVFKRVTGNCVWGHLYGFDTLHENIVVTNNRFEDIGLDGVLYGGVITGVCSGNSFRRIGYITLTDTDDPVPKWCPNAYAVALDTSGIVVGVSYSSNSFVSVNGGCIDLDGFGSGIVVGNSMRMPEPNEPEYEEDRISEIGPGGQGVNWCYGIQLSNTARHNRAASSVHITGNVIRGYHGGGIRIWGGRRCSVTGNTIIYTSQPQYPPISIGNLGTQQIEKAVDNVVTGNTIVCDYAIPAVIEDESYGPFDGSQRNIVANNRIVGQAYEFRSAQSSDTRCDLRLQTNLRAAESVDESIIQREGRYGTTGATKLYVRSDISSAQLVQVSDIGPTLNVSLNGQAYTGAISTAERTAIGVLDTVATGHLVCDAFLGIRDYGAAGSRWRDEDAALMDENWAIIRYNRGLGRIEWSEVVGGSRVWKSISAPFQDSTRMIDGPGGLIWRSDAVDGHAKIRFERTRDGSQLQNGDTIGELDGLAMTASGMSQSFSIAAVAYWPTSSYVPTNLVFKVRDIYGQWSDVAVVGADRNFYVYGYVHAIQGLFSQAQSDEAVKAWPGGMAAARYSIYTAQNQWYWAITSNYTRVGYSSSDPNLDNGPTYGAIYYNTSIGRFRMKTASGWSDIVSAPFADSTRLMDSPGALIWRSDSTNALAAGIRFEKTRGGGPVQQYDTIATIDGLAQCSSGLVEAFSLVAYAHSVGSSYVATNLLFKLRTTDGSIADVLTLAADRNVYIYGYAWAMSGLFSSVDSDEAVKAWPGGMAAARYSLYTSGSQWYIALTPSYTRVGYSSTDPMLSGGPDYGAIYYNTTTNKFRVKTDSGWQDLAGGGSSTPFPPGTVLLDQPGHLILKAATDSAGLAAGLNFERYGGTLQNPSNVGLNHTLVSLMFKAYYNGDIRQWGELVGKVQAFSGNLVRGNLEVWLAGPSALEKMFVFGCDGVFYVLGGYVNATSGLYTESISDEAVKVVNGGVSTKRLSVYDGATRTVVVYSNRFARVRGLYSESYVRPASLYTDPSPDQNDSSILGAIYYNAGVNKLRVALSGGFTNVLTANSSITELADVPDSFGQSGAVLAVNQSGNGVEFSPYLRISPPVCYLNGYYQSTDGFYTTSTAYNSIQAPNGGALFKTLNLEPSSYDRPPLAIKAAPSSTPTDESYVYIYAYNYNGTYQLRVKRKAGSTWEDREVALV